MFWGCSGAPWGPGGARPSRGPAWPGPRGTPGLLGPGPRPGGPALYRAPPSSRTGPSATSPNRKGPSSALMGAHPSGPLERTVNNYFGAGCSRYLFPSQRRRRGRQRGPILRGGKKRPGRSSRYFFPSQRRRRGRQRGPILRGGKKRPGRKPRHNKVDTFYNFACRATVCRVLEPVGPRLEGGALYNAGPPGT